MRVAVASQNFRTVTAHAGRCRRFLIFDVVDGATPVEAGRLDLPLEMAFHGFPDAAEHPLDGVAVLIAGSMGDGFARRMARRGIVARCTTETGPAAAAAEAAAALSAGEPAAATVLAPAVGGSDPASGKRAGDGQCAPKPSQRNHDHGHGCGCHHPEPA